ncbi:MAG TPA: alpha/beta fold hydrolase [Thermoanaerobaculia bacterium]|nr:alpha/beta fold hydrolase [Thermoanaerobaculia bacterium]
MERRSIRRLIGGLALAGSAAAVPALIHLLVRRQARPPHSPRWGRSHRFAGKLGPIVFQELGDGEPLVLLHAFGPGYDSSQWRAVAETLAASHRVYVPDLPGWGRSETTLPHRGLYVESLTDFLTRVVRQPAVVCAAGLPAAYAFQIAAERPDLVRALALVSPEGLADSPDGLGKLVLRQLLGVPLLRVSILDLLTSRPLLAHHLRREYAVPARADAAVLDHHYRVSHLPSTREALGAYLRGDLGAAGQAPSRLPVPAWLATASSPRLPPADPPELWLELLPHAHLESFADAGGLPHAEVPIAFSRALSRFVTALPNPAG